MDFSDFLSETCFYVVLVLPHYWAAALPHTNAASASQLGPGTASVFTASQWHIQKDLWDAHRGQWRIRAQTCTLAPVKFCPCHEKLPVEWFWSERVREQISLDQCMYLSTGDIYSRWLQRHAVYISPTVPWSVIGNRICTFLLICLHKNKQTKGKKKTLSLQVTW